MGKRCYSVPPGPMGGSGGAPADVTMAWVEEYRWDLTAETARDFKALGSTSHVSSATGLTNSVVGAAGSTVFRIGAAGLEAYGAPPYYVVDVGPHMNLGAGPAFHPMDRVAIVTRVDYYLPAGNDTITIATINGINSDGMQCQVQNIGGTVKIFASRYEPSASNSASAVTLNGGGMTGTVWVWHEVAGATHRISYSATEPLSWDDGTNLFTAEIVSESDATITTTDLDNGYRYYVQLYASAAGYSKVPTWVFRRLRAAAAADYPVTTEVNGTALTATTAPGGTSVVSVQDSTGTEIGTVNVGTGIVDIAGKWVLGFSHDLSAEATLDYDHTAATISLLGATWAQAGGTTYADDLDLTNGTGLVPNMSAGNGTFDTTAQTHWQITLALADTILFGVDYDPNKLHAVQVMLSGLGDAATELAGLFLGNDLGASDVTGAAGLGYSGAAAGLVKYRQQGGTVTASTAVATGAADCVMIIRKGGAWAAYYGTSSAGAWPTSWTQAGGSWSANTAASSGAAFVTATDLMGLWAATGNTSNNYAPVFRKMRGYIVDSEEPA